MRRSRFTDNSPYRGGSTARPDVTKFAETLEKVCIGTVESGFMTRGQAVLIGRIRNG